MHTVEYNYCDTDTVSSKTCTAFHFGNLMVLQAAVVSLQRHTVRTRPTKTTPPTLAFYQPFIRFYALFMH